MRKTLMYYNKAGKDKNLLTISFLDVQTVGLNGLEAPYPQFLPTRTNSLSMIHIFFPTLKSIS